MPPNRASHEQNRRSWNQATRVHNSHKSGQGRFLRDGGSTLFPEELALLGDLTDLELLHLQCNSGQDTLSLVARGAIATGVDISDEAISAARAMAGIARLYTEFVREDVYTFLEDARRAGRRWDAVFCSYGVTPWLSDIQTWARLVADVLRPEGRLVLVEFHPIAAMMDETGTRVVAPNGCDGHPVHYPEGVSDYVAASRAALVPWGYEPGLSSNLITEECHEFPWSLGQVIDAVLSSGLRLERLEEYPFSNGCRLLPCLVPLSGRRWGLPPEIPRYPLMYSLLARR